MGAKEKVVSVIKDPDLYKISFTIGSLRVIGREFAKLLPEINKNTLGIGVDPHISTPANYDPAKHIIRLKSDKVGNDIGSRAAIAHECAHAYLASQAPDRITGEAAGYLVEVLYNLAKAPKATRRQIALNPLTKPPTGGDSAIGKQALAVIEKYGMDKGSRFLSAAQVESLKQAIRCNPVYGSP